MGQLIGVIFFFIAFIAIVSFCTFRIVDGEAGCFSWVLEIVGALLIIYFIIFMFKQSSIEAGFLMVCVWAVGFSIAFLIGWIARGGVADFRHKKQQKEKEQKSIALLTAMKNNDKESVQKLIEEGGDVNYIDYKSNDNSNPLQIAIENSDEDMVSLLISKGADVNLYFGGKRPLDLAENKKIKSILKSYGAKTQSEIDAAEKERTKLIDACKEGRLDDAKNLIESGFDLEIRDEKGRTALMLVVDSPLSSSSSLEDSLERNNDIAKLLIKYGAEIDARDNKGLTATMHSARLFRWHLPLLIESGADVNAKDNTGVTVLMYACIKAKAEYIEFLIKNGADVNARENDNYETALMFATFDGNIDAVITLIKNGADVNAISLNHRTALIIATERGYAEIKNILINSGAYH